MTEDTAGEVRRERKLEYKREWRRRNADRINEGRRQYRRENKAEISEQRRRERLADPEKYRERTRKWRRENPDKVREMSRRRAPLRESMKTIHGREWRSDYTAFWRAQDGCCYLCGEMLPEDAFPNPPGRGPAIDHDHRCCAKGRSCRACRRGIACQRCNTAVGLFGDDPLLLRRVADSLESARGLVEERLSGRLLQATLF